MQLWSHEEKEMDKIIELINATKKVNMLEIGANKLTFTEFLLNNASNKVITMDLKDKRPQKRLLLELKYPNFKFVLGDCRSQKCFNEVSKFLENANYVPEKIDVFFVDGKHAYSAAKRDTELYMPFVADDGVVIWHDAINTHDQVYMYIDELQQQGLEVGVIDTIFPGRPQHPVGLAWTTDIVGLKEIIKNGN